MSMQTPSSATPVSTTLHQSSLVERPITAVGPIHWLRKNLFHSWLDTALTVIVGIVTVSALSRFLGWATSEAQWTVITANFRVLMQGLYPIDQGWRLILSVTLMAALAGLSWGVWGRMVARTLILLLLATLLF